MLKNVEEYFSPFSKKNDIKVKKNHPQNLKCRHPLELRVITQTWQNWNLYAVHKISKIAIYRLQVYMSNMQDAFMGIGDIQKNFK